MSCCVSRCVYLHPVVCFFMLHCAADVFIVFYLLLFFMCTYSLCSFTCPSHARASDDWLLCGGVGTVYYMLGMLSKVSSSGLLLCPIITVRKAKACMLLLLSSSLFSVMRSSLDYASAIAAWRSVCVHATWHSSRQWLLGKTRLLSPPSSVFLTLLTHILSSFRSSPIVFSPSHAPLR